MLSQFSTIRTISLALALIWLSLTVGTLCAQEATGQSSPEESIPLTGNDLVSVTLQADIERFQPGQEFTLAVKYDIKPGWHLYWRNPGDNGMPPSISITAAPDVVVGEPLYPRPKIFQVRQGDSIQTSFGYEKTVCLLVPIKITPGFNADRLELSVELEWFVCKDICLIGSERQVFSLSAALPQRPATIDPAGLRLIKIWRNRMPLSAVKARVSASLRGDSLLVSGPAGLSRQVLFIPDLTPGVTPAGPVPASGVVFGSRFTLEVPLDIRPQDALGQPLRVAGLVLLGSYDRPRAISVDLPVPTPSPDAPDSSVVEASSTQ